MTDAKMAEVVPAQPNVAINFDLEKDDLVAIAVSREELRLKEERVRLDAAIKTKRQEIQDKRSDVSDILKTAFEDKFKGYAETLKTSLEPFQITVESISYELNDITYFLEDPTQTDYQGQVVFYDQHQRRVASYGVVLPVTAGMESLRDEIKELRDQETALMADAMDVRRKLSELDTLERQAKAAIAESVLAQSAQGKAMLASIQDVKSLEIPKLTNG